MRDMETVYIETTVVRHPANAHILLRLRREAARQGWKLTEVCTPLQLMG